MLSRMLRLRVVTARTAHPSGVSRFLRSATLLAVSVIGTMMLGTGVSGAHNALESSTPADGSTLTQAPTSIALNFKSAVPLESATATLIAPTGARTEVTGLTLGDADTQVLVPTIGMTTGAWSLRWRLVSPDGHVITDTVDFTIAQSAQTTVPTQPTVASTAAPAASGAAAPAANGSSGATGNAAPTTAATIAGADGEASSAAASGGASDQGDPWSTPSPLTWILRLASLLTFCFLIGGVVTAMQLWPTMLANPEMTRYLRLGTTALAGITVLQLWLQVADIAGQAPWAVLDDVWSASGYGPVKGALGRLAACAILLVAVPPIAGLAASRHDDQPNRQQRRTNERGIAGSPAGSADVTLLYAGCVVIAASYAFSGHAASLRWPVIGVPLDIVHLIAAGAWLGPMIFLGPLGGRPGHNTAVGGRRSAADDGHLAEWREAVRNFADVANAAVWTIVATGVLQTLRIHGFGSILFSTTHGRLLLVKVVLLACLLWAANINRQRVARRLDQPDRLTTGIAEALRRAMATELVVGGTIIAVTAWLMVQTPAT